MEDEVTIRLLLLVLSWLLTAALVFTSAMFFMWAVEALP